MISMIKYISEALTKGLPSAEEAPTTAGNIARGPVNFLGLATKGQVSQARDQEGNEWAKKLAKQRAEHSEALKKAASKVKTELSGDTSGTEAAGHALKKGAEAAGEAAGSFGKKAMEFAGEHPAAAAGTAALAAGFALARKRKSQPQSQQQ